MIKQERHSRQEIQNSTNTDVNASLFYMLLEIAEWMDDGVSLKRFVNFKCS